MQWSDNQKQSNKKITEAQTVTVPFALGEIKNNISISTNSLNKYSKEQLMNQAFNFHSQENMSKAAKYYQYFINQGFNDHRVFSNYGAILKNLGKSTEAELSIRKAIELKPDFVEAHFNLGNILKALGNLEEAEKSLRKAIQIKPDYSEAHNNLGNILNDLGNPKEAVIAYLKAIELNPNSPDYHSNLGIILKDLGELQDAKVEQKKGIDMNFIQNIDSKYKENCLKNLSLSKSQFRQDLFALSQLNFKIIN